MYGMNQERSFLSKKLKLEGTLEAVKVSLKNEDVTIMEVTTRASGHYNFDTELGHLYTLTFEKNGYAPVSITVDMRTSRLPEDPSSVYLENMEVVLVKDKKSLPIELAGRIHYNYKTGRIAISPNIDLLKDYSGERTVVLLQKSVDEGKFRFVTEMVSSTGEKHAPKLRWKSHTNEEGEIDSTLVMYEPIIEIGSEFLTREVTTSEGIAAARTQLDSLWQYAATAQDSLILRQQEMLIDKAESELMAAKKLIALQNNEITAQKNKNLWLSIALALLVIMIGGGVKYYLDRRKTFMRIRSYNRKINESLEVARRIQNSVFNRLELMAGIFSDSFIMNKPRDGVSGDFYWLEEHNNKVYFAVADCTGHGVPGCLLSLLGNQLLHEIILEKNISSPDNILSELHLGVVKHLQQDKNFSADGGMDIAICVIDKKEKVIHFSGAMSMVYIVDGQTVKYYRGDILPVGGLGIRKKKGGERTFRSQSIPYKEGQGLYMLSDGLIDQFGGVNDEKYGVKRFEAFLAQNSSLAFDKQASKLNKELQSWMSGSAQIDDILVTGVKL